MPLSDKEKSELYKRAEAKTKDRGRPFFGATERDLLKLMNEFEPVKKLAVDVRDRAEKNQKTLGGLTEAARQNQFFQEAILRVMIAKGYMTRDEFQSELNEVQYEHLKLVRKDSGIAEPGDAIVCSWVILCDGEIVDDTTRGPIVYDLGSGKFPFESHIVGMTHQEEKSIDLIWPACDALPQIAGKDVRVNLIVQSVRRKAA